MRFLLVISAFCLAFASSAFAQGRDVDFYHAERAFNRLEPQNRVLMQLALTAAGYWPAVPNQTYSLRLHREVVRFQRDHGLIPRGIQNALDASHLIDKSLWLLKAWDLRIVTLPGRYRFIVVPAGLDLQVQHIEGGYRFRAAKGSFILEFSALEGSRELFELFRHLLRAEVEKAGDKITYEVVKPTFFVIQGEQGLYKRYSRYHLDGPDIIGFDMYWSGDGPPVFGDRLVTIISGSLWSSMTGSPYPDFKFFEIPSNRSSPPAYTRAPELSPAPVPSAPGRSIPTQNYPVPPPEEPKVQAKVQPKAEPEPAPKVSSGTGFFVTKDGHIVTNEHVIDTCSTVEVTPSGRDKMPARVVAKDKKNDLAVLKVQSTDHPVAKIRLGTRLGEPVAVFGFPLSVVLSSSGNFTIGNITALSGLGDDERHLQISAPVQLGNSGGPLLDESGNVVGVVAAKMNTLAALSALGDVPQNVNFAIKTTTLVNFLDVNGIPYEPGRPGEALKPSDLADRAKEISVFIKCQ
jgi:Trypsin-like serine proteases, typically periplasmic, contain C-terminal PDZ domain